MLTIRDNTLSILSGRLTVNALLIDELATLNNDSEVYTHTTVSAGAITGSGTLWARWDTSEFIGGTIDAAQTVIYYGDRPTDRSFIQIMAGALYIQAPAGSGSIIT